MTGEEYGDWYTWQWLEGKDYHAKNGWNHKIYGDREAWEKQGSRNVVTKPTEYEYEAEFFFEGDTRYSMYHSFHSLDSMDRCIKELTDLREAWRMAEISKRIKE